MTQPPYNPLDPMTPPPSPQVPPTPDATPVPPTPNTASVPPAPQQPYQGAGYPPQAPQAPQAPYPPQQPQQPSYVAPAAPAPKKKRTGLVVAIIIVAVALVGTGVFFGYRSVVGNRLTPYCKAFASVGDQMDDLESQMNDATSDEDMDQMGEIMGEMIDLFDQLRNASPPDTVSPSLDTVYDYLTHIKEAIDSGDMSGYIDYVSQHDPDEFMTAATTVDTESLAYCNG